MYKGALLYATKNRFPNCMKMTGKMGGNKFAKPDPVLSLQLSYDAEMTVVGTSGIVVILKLTSRGDISAISWLIFKKLVGFKSPLNFE